MGGREVGGLVNQLAAHMEFSPESRARVAGFWRTDRLAPGPGLKAVELFEAIAAGRVKAVWIMATRISGWGSATRAAVATWSASAPPRRAEAPHRPPPIMVDVLTIGTLEFLLDRGMLLLQRHFSGEKQAVLR